MTDDFNRDFTRKKTNKPESKGESSKKRKRCFNSLTICGNENHIYSDIAHTLVKVGAKPTGHVKCLHC